MSVVLTVTRDIRAAPERVFDAWVDPAIAARFLFATPDGVMEKVAIDARVGGRFLVVERRPMGLAEHHGEYVAIDRPHRLVFLFRATMNGAGSKEGDWTRVALDFEGIEGGTRVTLTHEMAPEWAEYADRTQHGWTTILAGLDAFWENDDGR